LLPVFNKEQGAIYLREMEVVDAKVKPEKLTSVVQTLIPYLNQSLRWRGWLSRPVSLQCL
jgi:hypothetical protein